MIPGDAAIEREMAALPGLGRLQAIRRIQARDILSGLRRPDVRFAGSEARPIGEIIRPIVERAAAAVREHEDWIDRLTPAEARVIWTRPIHEWRDMAGVVLPFTADGIARLQAKAEGAA